MPNVFIRSGLLVLVVFILSGCGVQVKSYAQVRERVDQAPSGNAGYLTGAPSAGENKNVKTTRRVYVVEFSKENQEEDLTVAAPAARSTPSPYVQPEQVETPKERIILPSFDSEDAGDSSDSAEPSGLTEAVEYTIEKDDTMQKISKKFYDSYSKWPRIYEANKDKIPDPNRIKPGTVITIPALQ